MCQVLVFSVLCSENVSISLSDRGFPGCIFVCIYFSTQFYHLGCGDVLISFLSSASFVFNSSDSVALHDHFSVNKYFPL